MTQTPRKKRTITEIRDSKQTGERMVYTSVPDYTSARWAHSPGFHDSTTVVGCPLEVLAGPT